MSKFNIFFLVLLTFSSADVFPQYEELRDPTRPISYDGKKTKTASLKLQAVFVRENGREAIIDGRSVSEGGQVGHCIVKKIEEKKVYCNTQGKTSVLLLRPKILSLKGVD